MSDKTARKHFLVLPSYQIKLVSFLIALLLIGSIIHGFFLYSITARGIEEGFMSAHNRLRSTWEILKPAIVLTNGISFLLLSLSFLMVSIFLSHRLIGPLFKLSTRIRQIAEGRLDLPPVKLRKGDEGQILTDAVNSMQNRYFERFSILKELRRKIEKGPPPSEAEIRTALDKALERISFEEPRPN